MPPGADFGSFAVARALQKGQRMSTLAIAASPASEPAVLSVADCIATCLVHHGIELATTVPGGPLMPLLQSFHVGQRIRCVLARHECGAAMMAEGYFRTAARPAVVALTAGPGVTNAVTGIALARAEQSAMVVVTAQVARSWFGRGAAQELDAVKLLESVTKLSVRLEDPNQAWSTVSEAVRLAQRGCPGPVHLSVPADLWTLPTSPGVPAVELVAASESADVALEPADIASLADATARASRPVVLVGYGVLLARAERWLIALSEKFPNLRFACTPRSKGAFPESHPSSVGVFGFAGRPEAERAVLEESDLLVVFGSRLGEITTAGWDERLGRRPIIQVDLDPTVFGKTYPVQLGIRADLRAVLAALTQGVPQRKFEPPPSGGPRDRLWVTDAADGRVHPERLVAAMNRTLGDDANVWCDIGNTMAWLIHHLQRNQPRRWQVNLNWGSMGHALPAAIGGVLASGERALVGVGDAAFAMTGFELHTAVEHGLPIVVVVLNDSGHGMVELGSEFQFGPGRVPNARFSRRIDAAAFARSIGADASSATTCAEFEAALRHAWTSVPSTRVPHVIDVHVDPSAVPPFGSRMKLLKQNFAGVSQDRGTAT